MSIPRFARRSLPVLALGTCLALSACGGTDTAGASPTPARTSSATGPWEFTDDRGTTVTRTTRPQRIVAQVHAAAALWDFGVRPVGIFGPYKRADGSADPQAGNVDVNSVSSIGAAFGEFNLEALAALKPDLIVTIMYGPALWYVPEDRLRQIESIAPVVGIRLDNVALQAAIERFGALSQSLGMDLTAPQVADARAAFDRASAAVREAARSKPGLKVEVVIGQEAGLYVADPAWHGDIRHLRDLGVDLVTPNKSEPAFGFETLSWELADAYSADLLLEDARTLGLTPEQLSDQYPTWKRLPAVRANQVAAWRAETPSSYRLHAGVLEEIAAAIRNARPDVV